MKMIIQWLENIFRTIPLPLLEVWGRFGYLFGLLLMIFAYGRFTFRPGGHFKIGREKQTWDTKALLCIALTFVLIVTTGLIGSSIVIVPGAQTFESLKDLTVFLCIVIFGFPALIIAPFSYGVSDLLEGVPPNFLLDWIFGYFINPACFWIAYQLIGRDPDFKKMRTWKNYVFFIFIFMMIEPQLWGYICSNKFTSEISFRNITPALFFTTSITWILGPLAMLAALPIAKKFGLFWADIPGYVKEKPWRSKDWIWESGKAETKVNVSADQKLPIRMFLLTPFAALVLVMVIATAYITLKSTEKSAKLMAVRLHQEVGENIKFRLDNFLENSKGIINKKNVKELDQMLGTLAIAKHGRSYIVDYQANAVASSHPIDQDQIWSAAVKKFKQKKNIDRPYLYEFDYVTAKPLSRQTWSAHLTPYFDKEGRNTGWILLTIIPESYYLAGIHAGNSRFAMVFAVALLLSLFVTAILSKVVTSPICSISSAAEKLAEGDLTVKVPGSWLNELDVLSDSFNNMTVQLQRLFNDLKIEIETRKKSEHELKISRHLLHASESRLKLALKAGKLGIWDWDIKHDVLIWDEGMYMQYGIKKENFESKYEGWETRLLPEDYERLTAEVQAALRGERNYDTEFRVRWPDNSIHFIKGIAQTIRNAAGEPVRMVGINYDITKEKIAEEDLLLREDALAELLKSREEFLLIASHELKTPITSLKLRLQNLQRHATGDQKLEQESNLLIGQINRLTKLVDDMLDVSRIQSGKLTMEISDVDLNELINEVLNQYSPQIALSKCKVITDLKSDIFTLMDRSRMTQVLVNILSNAFKYAQGSTIRISTSINEDIAKLIIEDTGPGIPKNKQDLLFKRFERAGALYSIGGLGLGLYISKQIIENHGGTISMLSEEGMGTSIIIELPHSRVLGEVLPSSWH